MEKDTTPRGRGIVTTFTPEASGDTISGSSVFFNNTDGYENLKMYSYDALPVTQGFSEGSPRNRED